MKINLKRLSKTCYNNEFGNAIVEYILILSVIATIIFSLASIGLKLKEQFVTSTCRINCLMTEVQYKSYLDQNGVNHLESLLEHFVRNLDDICPENNRVSYVDGKVKCSGHFGDDTGSSNDDNGGGEVPFL